MPCSLCKGLGIVSAGHNKLSHDKWMTAKCEPVEDVKSLFVTPKEVARAKAKSSDGLRGVLPESEIIWKHRNDLDAYSEFTRATIGTHNPERDHVFEIQLLDAAYFEYSSVAVQMVTRGEKDRIMNIANNVKNLNITTRSINQSKKGPFTNARNELVAQDFDSSQCNGIDSFVFNSHGTRLANRYPGFTTSNWNNIKREVVKSYDILADEIPNVIANEKRSEAFRDCLHEVFMSLRIEEGMK